MRKLLLASAAIVGATGGLAYAQPAPSQGQLVAPYGSGPAANNNNNSWGTANTPSGSAAAGPLSTIYAPNVIAVPTPGTVVIRLNGRVEVDLNAGFSNLNTGVGTTGTTAAVGTTAAQIANPTGAGYKLNPLGIGTYMRLYPGFDGLAANGLRYGAAIELRENFYAGTIGTTNATVTPAGNQPSGTGGAASGSGNTSAETVFVRRAFTYLASDQAGLLRLGQGDGVLGLFDNCIFTTQCWDAGVGNFNGGGPSEDMASGAQPPFVWLAQAGAEYGNNKIVYLSPQFFGFDFGFQYAPSEGNSLQNDVTSSPLQTTTCNQAGQNCISVTSGNDPTRWYNQVGVGARYQQTFGAVDFKAYGFWETAGKEDLTTATYLPPSTVPGTYNGNSTARLRYDNLNFYKAGTAITAFNTTAAVDYIGGAVNGQLAMRPTGGVPTNAVLGGLTYANGPIVLGIEYGVIDTQGQANLTGITQRHEYEFATGGTYKVAPGLALVAEYMYMHRHQGDFNFATGVAGAGTHDIQSQGMLLSTVLTW
jgi:hypothetical protein